MKIAIIAFLVVVGILVILIGIVSPPNRNKEEWLTADVIDDELYDTFNDDLENVSFYDDMLDDEL